MSFHKHFDPPFSVIVLNSGALKARAIAQILEGNHDDVRLFLDNDQTTYSSSYLVLEDDCENLKRPIITSVK